MRNEHGEASEQPSPPTPNPALRRLDRLVGTWKMAGHPLGSDERTITGTTRFAWLHNAGGKGFFLQQDMDMDYDGKAIRSHELIGYDPETRAFASLVYSNMAAEPWPYAWDIVGDDLTISIRKPPMDATFTGRFAEDGSSFSGSWRPNPGADETVNTSYDVTVTRIGD